MASIFTRTNEYVQPVKRNTFDLSFQNNLTMQFGKLYPVFVQEVIPGDAFKIKPTFALEFMPMVFPVQTRMRANLHFFYVRNRNLWEDFPDFIANTKEVEPPYLDMNGRYDNFLAVGQLGDYLGLPTSIYGVYGNSLTLEDPVYVGTNFMDNISSGTPVPEGQHYFASYDEMLNYLDTSVRLTSNSRYYVNNSYFWDKIISHSYNSTLGNGNNLFGFYQSLSDSQTYDAYSKGFVLQIDINGAGQVHFPNFVDNIILFVGFTPGVSTPANIPYQTYLMITADKIGIQGSRYTVTREVGSDTCRYTIDFSSAFADSLYEKIKELDSTGEYLIKFGAIFPNPDPSVQNTWSNPEHDILGDNSGASFESNLVVSSVFSMKSAPDMSLSPDKSPYYDSVANPNGIKVSALVPRGIETIYNAFYRDIRNNPFMIDGQPEYNKYLENKKGGADTTPYKLHYRNWEQDFLTTAVQSPQQGQAPLVGISSNGQLKFQSEDGEVFTAQAKFAEDGETLTGFTVESPNMPAGNLRALVDMASSGISINDLRNVNSLQRWLENNMRKGLRLKDQIKAHFNVDIRYDELDMPEFIGGCSETIDVRMVTQTSSDVEDSPLGSYAGQATCVGTSNHNISHYCDEHGFIIGIFSVAPVPNYSQLLPKHFIKRNVLDYFFPEFGHIGYQPIRYNEVCPIETFNSHDDLNDTFGYQRAWYDYLARVDEVHGLFRTSLRNYLMNRVFNVKPQLAESFLLVDPAQLNDVFATNVVDPVTGEVKDDKILGQIYFDVKAKRPIPMFGIPRLE